MEDSHPPQREQVLTITTLKNTSTPWPEQEVATVNYVHLHTHTHTMQTLSPSLHPTLCNLCVLIPTKR